MMPVDGASVFSEKPFSCQNSFRIGHSCSGVRPSTTSQRRSPSRSMCMPSGSCALGTPSVALPLPPARGGSVPRPALLGGATNCCVVGTGFRSLGTASGGARVLVVDPVGSQIIVQRIAAGERTQRQRHHRDLDGA
jgi:hypothetical protein